MVLQVKTKEVVRDNIRGPLSIFTNLSGKSEITVDKKRVTVTPENFFISNAGQHYTLEVCEKTPTETFNIHFGEHFTEGLRDTRTDAHQPADHAHGQPQCGATQ